MSTYDWSKFSTRISIRSDFKTLYRAWTTTAWLERWFLRLAEFTGAGKGLRNRDEAVIAGDTYRWLWHGYDDSVVEKGSVVEANGADLLRFTFAGDCLVTVTLKTEEGETVVELTQENIPLDETSRANYHLGCLTGWTFYLANLKSVLEGGIDLRNKNVKLRKVINS